jgi:hypothetical protein
MTKKEDPQKDVKNRQIIVDKKYTFCIIVYVSL